MTRFAFSKNRLDDLPVPENGRRYVYDTKTAGLALCTTAAGCKTFYFCRRINGPYQRLLIGRWPGLSVEQARREAARLTGQIAEGINPQDRKQAARGETTLGQLWEHFLAVHARPHKKPRSCREDERLYGRHLAQWANRKLSAVHKTDVQRVHTAIGRNTPYEANHVLALAHTLFEHARDLGFEGPNPADGIRRFKETARERFLQADELPRFFKALRKEPSTKHRDFFLICLFTGARRGNVQAMRWADVNLDRGTWTIPDTKANKPQTVVLTAPAVVILRSREVEAAGAEWVFPGRRDGRFLGEPGKVWKKVLARAGIQDLRIHDLRRTLGSWAAAGGVSLPIIGAALGHHDFSTTQIYARLSLDPVRGAIEATVQTMLAVGGQGRASAPALPPARHRAGRL